MKYVAVCEEFMPGNSELSEAFPSGKELTRNSCWVPCFFKLYGHDKMLESQLADVSIEGS